MDFRPTVFVGTNLEPPLLEILATPLSGQMHLIKGLRNFVACHVSKRPRVIVVDSYDRSTPCCSVLRKWWSPIQIAVI